jgi:hypothetical protein
MFAQPFHHVGLFLCDDVGAHKFSCARFQLREREQCSDRRILRVLRIDIRDQDDGSEVAGSIQGMDNNGNQ